MNTFVTQARRHPNPLGLGPGVLAFVVYAWRSTLPPVDPPAPTVSMRRRFSVAPIRRSGRLRHVSYRAWRRQFCGRPRVAYALRYDLLDQHYPRLSTGIGHWSEAAFQRAMREGVDRQGVHLYPAFPYDHFTLVNDADNAALYAFMMTRQPVEAKTPENDLPFPLNIRCILAGWKLLFLREGPYQPDAAHDEQWNRGAYLANGIGHCGACHTPRNSFGAQIATQHFAGGEAEGWHAPAINSNSQSYEAWTAEGLHAFLGRGWHEQHGGAHGPMAPVSQNLALVPDADVEAIATYIASAIGTPKRKPPGKPTSDTANNDTGAQIYVSACAGCHDGRRPLPFGGARLIVSTAVSGESATNLVNVILDGLQPPEGTAGAIMPGFASSLTDGQVESLVAYIRSNFGGKPPWTGVESSLREARSRHSD